MSASCADARLCPEGAKRSASADAPLARKQMTFVVGGKDYSLPVDQVDRIVNVAPSHIYDLPVANEKLLGFLNLDGQAVAVAAFPFADPVAAEKSDSERCFIVIRMDNIRFAFAVDRVLSVGETASGTAISPQDMWERMVKGERSL